MPDAASSRYKALADQLRAEIVAGRYAPGERFPSEAALRAEHGVSRGTVVKALETLVAEGLVTRRQGLGSFVAGLALRRRPGRLLSFSEAVARQGHEAGHRFLAQEPVPAAEARALGFSEAAVRLVRLRLVDGVALALHRTLVPAAVVDRLGDPAAPGFSLYAALETAGLAVVRAEEHVGARLARSAEADLLGLPAPAALIAVLRRGRTGGGRLVEATDAVHSGDCYSFEIELARGHGTAPHRLVPAVEEEETRP